MNTLTPQIILREALVCFLNQRQASPLVPQIPSPPRSIDVQFMCHSRELHDTIEQFSARFLLPAMAHLAKRVPWDLPVLADAPTTIKGTAFVEVIERYKGVGMRLQMNPAPMPGDVVFKFEVFPEVVTTQGVTHGLPRKSTQANSGGAVAAQPRPRGICIYCGNAEYLNTCGNHSPCCDHCLTYLVQAPTAQWTLQQQRQLAQSQMLQGLAQQQTPFAQMNMLQQMAQVAGMSPQALQNTYPNPIVEKPAPPLKTEKIQLGEITGWRGWSVTPNGFLKAFSQDVIWAPNEIMEGKPKGHDGPGIYAFRHLRQFLKDFSDHDMIYGQVHLWGDVIEHELGWRSEFAKIVSLEGHTNVRRGNADWPVERLRDRYRLAA